MFFRQEHKCSGCNNKGGPMDVALGFGMSIQQISPKILARQQIILVKRYFPCWQHTMRRSWDCLLG